MMPTNLEELKQWLVQELPKWLKEYPELRYTIEGMLAETFVRRDEWQELVRAIERLTEAQQELTKTVQELARRQDEFAARQEEHSRILQEHTRILEEHSRAIERLVQAVDKHARVLERHGERIDRLEWLIGSIGRRWGVLTEEAFRQTYQGLLSPFGFTVERFLRWDEEGFVFGRPEQVEFDLLIRDDLVIAAEVRASVSRADVLLFSRKVDFAEQVLQRRVHRRVIVSPFLEQGARELAQQSGIEVYTAPQELGEEA